MKKKQTKNNGFSVPILWRGSDRFPKCILLILLAIFADLGSSNTLQAQCNSYSSTPVTWQSPNGNGYGTTLSGPDGISITSNVNVGLNPWQAASSGTEIVFGNGGGNFLCYNCNYYY